jgi:hypothetical protein
VNQRTERANARVEYKTTDSEGNKVTLSGDEGEIAYLTDTLRKGTAEQQRSAAKTLLDVHSNNVGAVRAVSEHIKGLKESGRASDAQQADRMIEDNLGAAGGVPQVIKPNSEGTVNGLDASQLHSLKSGALGHFLQDPGAREAIANRTLASLQNENERGMVRESNLGTIVESLRDSNPDHELVRLYDSRRSPAPTPPAGGGGGDDAPRIILPGDAGGRVGPEDLPRPPR